MASDQPEPKSPGLRLAFDVTKAKIVRSDAKERDSLLSALTGHATPEEAAKAQMGLVYGTPRCGLDDADSSALHDPIPLPVSPLVWLRQQPAKMEPTPARAEEASAWYRLISFLVRSDTIPCNRENMVEAVKRYLDDTKGNPSPSVSLPDVAKAAHPDDEAAAKRLLLALGQATFSGHLPYCWPSGEDASKRLFLAVLTSVQSGHLPSYVQGDEYATKWLLSGLEHAAQSVRLPFHEWDVLTHEDASKQLGLAMWQAVQSGHLPLSVFDDVAITFPDLSAWLAAWPECPAIAENSPLRHWLSWLPVVGAKGAAAEATTPAPAIFPQSASSARQWSAQTPHGFMRCDKTSGGRLVHLAEVAAHLSSGPHAMPRVEVIYRLWSPLIIAASEGRVPAVYVTNSQDYARPLVANNRPNPAVADVWGFLPDVNEKSSAEDVLRALGDGWERCWPGLSDPSKDAGYTHQQATKGRRERDEELRLRIFWPDDGFLQNLLNRIAVPLALAAELWGYVVESLDPAATLTVASAASVVDSKPETAGTSCPSDAEHQGLMVSPIQAQPAPAKRIRRDLLTPLLDKAVQDCEGDPNQVFMRLREWASEKPPRQPLRGATEDGLQWVDANDKAQTLNIEALKKRLRRRQ